MPVYQGYCSNYKVIRAFRKLLKGTSSLVIAEEKSEFDFTQMIRALKIHLLQLNLSKSLITSYGHMKNS